jgi:hypothetical protein
MPAPLSPVIFLSVQGVSPLAILTLGPVRSPKAIKWDLSSERWTQQLSLPVGEAPPLRGAELTRSLTVPHDPLSVASKEGSSTGNFQLQI